MIFFKNAFFSGIIAVIALWITLICVYTPSCPYGVFLAVSAASAIALYSYRCQSWHTRGGMLLMLACAAVVGSGVILNCWYFTTASGGTDSAPVFQNFDASLNWEFLTMSNIEDLRTDRFPGICFNRTSGYPYLMALLCWPFGPSLAFLLGFNMLCVLLTIILCGSITRRCCPGHGLAAPLCGMCVLAANCYFMVTGTIFIKDALVQLIFACITNLLCRMRHNSQPERLPAIGCLGALLMIALVRHQLIPLMVPGFIILLSGKRRLWPVLIMLCAFSAIIYTAVMMLPTHEQYDTVFSVLNGPRATHPDRVTTFIVDNSRTELIYSITGNLDEQMPWMRLLWLPVTMLCQFLIPFPWNFTRDMIYGPSQL
ncbi:MAG: hypothetical protein K2L80_00690 [Muribaculaceae bacterium]|nr:hypothetical protein [Muribaculaceae bacterium]